jgi:hypothetical protein
MEYLNANKYFKNMFGQKKAVSVDEQKRLQDMQLITLKR